MKKHIKNLLHSLGYTLIRNHPEPDANLYQRTYPSASIVNRHFYNLGAGDFYHPCWTNVDKHVPEKFLRKSDASFIRYDFFSGENLPVPDGAAEVVYSSHALAHVHDHAAKKVISEAHRMLKPGGTFRVVTADIDLMYHAWKNNDPHFFYWKHSPEMNDQFQSYGLKIPMKKASLSQVFLEEFAASASEIASEGAAERISDQKLHQLFEQLPYEEALDYCVSRCPAELQEKYPFRHMNWFNEQKLSALLHEAGFNNIYRSRYLQSRVPVLRNRMYFDNTVPQLSLYMEAQK